MPLFRRTSWPIESEKSEHCWGWDCPLRTLLYLKPRGFSIANTPAFISKPFLTTTHVSQVLFRRRTDSSGKRFIHQYSRNAEGRGMLLIVPFVFSTTMGPLLRGWKSFYSVKFRNEAFCLSRVEALDFEVIALTWCVPTTGQSQIGRASCRERV